MSRPFLVAFFLLSLIIVPSYAKDQPLRVAVNPYSSPFVMRGNHQIYGFDIAMMDKLCEIINRDCQYVMMNFDQIIPSIMNKNVDLGISDITITLERAKLVNFTMPYMTSRTSFLGKKELQNSVITPTFLQDKTIAVGIGVGILMGICYVLVGLPGPTLMGFITAFAAMIPFVVPIVLLIASLILIFTGGMISAIIVIVWGTFIMFMADHFVKPVLIGGAIQLPFLAVLFGILGGVETLGLLGLFLGPVIMVLFITLWGESQD